LEWSPRGRRPGDADVLVVGLWPIDEHLFVGRLVVGDALERDVRDDAAVAVSRRWRARASGTRLVSIVIQRRPHCSATYAVVPDPQVGSRTRSPGSVVIKTQRCTTLVLV
jgi:hypothetical protein